MSNIDKAEEIIALGYHNHRTTREMVQDLADANLLAPEPESAAVTSAGRHIVTGTRYLEVDWSTEDTGYVYVSTGQSRYIVKASKVLRLPATVLTPAGPPVTSEAVDNEAPTIVCLCGSTRFYDEFQEANYDLTMRGEIVLSVGVYPHSKAKGVHGEGVGHDSVEKVALDELHKRKIDLADYVYVINPGGYIGESTRSEIHYAYQHGKPVTYQVEPTCDHADLDCPPGPCDRFYPPVVDRGRDG